MSNDREVGISLVEHARNGAVEHYEDRIVAAFTFCSIVWAIAGMAAGVYAAAELIWPELNFGLPWLSFGRLRTGHTNLVLFGFGVSALIGTSFYSVQRTSHARLLAPKLAWFVFYGWQLTIVLGAWSLLAAGTAARSMPSSSGRSTSRSP